MGEEARWITPVPLTRDGWASFGWLPVADTDPTDGDHLLDYAWHDVHVNLIGHRTDEVPTVPGGLRCEVLFRHATHTQVVMPLDVTAVVVVAPAGLPMASDSDADQIRAFVIEPLSAIVLYRGTWHWGPYPMTGESVSLFNVQGLRYREDNDSVDLAALGQPVVVRTRA
jgi:ureidoglycolate hydrolase